jgi:hypothetical protein
LLLPAASVKTPPATSTVMFPVEFGGGVTTKVYCVLDTAVKIPAVPPATVMSPAVKVVLASLKLKVYVTSPVAVPTALSVMAMVGTAVSNA